MSTDSEDLLEIFDELPEARRPFSNILTAGQPRREHFPVLEEAGFSKVINLRTAHEPGTWDEKPAAEDYHFDYVHLPIRGARDLTRDVVEKFDNELDQSEGKVLVHCASSNRVGAIFALRAAWLEGATTEEALDIGRSAGLDRLEPATRKLLETSD